MRTLESITHPLNICSNLYGFHGTQKGDALQKVILLMYMRIAWGCQTRNEICYKHLLFAETLAQIVHTHIHMFGYETRKKHWQHCHQYRICACMKKILDSYGGGQVFQ